MRLNRRTGLRTATPRTEPCNKRLRSLDWTRSTKHSAERVEVYAPPARTQFGGLLGDTEEWVNGAVGWREPGDPFCR